MLEEKQKEPSPLPSPWVQGEGVKGPKHSIYFCIPSRSNLLRTTGAAHPQEGQKEPTVQVRKIGIIMNGVTGRMGTNQHLVRSVLAIIKQGGIKVSDDLVIMPDPILTG